VARARCSVSLRGWPRLAGVVSRGEILTPSQRACPNSSNKGTIQRIFASSSLWYALPSGGPLKRLGNVARSLGDISAFLPYVDDGGGTGALPGAAPLGNATARRRDRFRGARSFSRRPRSAGPSSSKTGTGRLLWHVLGPKTIELIHEHVHVDAIRDDLETLALDADLLEAVLGTPDPEKKSKEIEIKISRRLRNRGHDPRFKELGERLEELKTGHEQGLLLSVEFLKALLDLARDVVAAESAAEPIADETLGKAALSELFDEVRNAETPIIVERVVADIDEIVRLVRFDGWQHTHAGEREVKIALRKTLFKYKFHQDQELFDRAYGYIRQYY
jgi:hypothetical protein